MPNRLIGTQHVKYWNTTTPSSCGSAQGANPANMGAGAAPVQSENTGYYSALEDAGIRAGEIIAYRAWYVIDGVDGLELHSIFWPYKWKPGATEAANMKVAACSGFHAFKDRKLLEPYIQDHLPGSFFHVTSVATGRVALWGEVIEHKLGYRAQYASVRGITKAYPGLDQQPGFLRRFWFRKPAMLVRLRERYGVGE
jgi:hypothetical protein